MLQLSDRISVKKDNKSQRKNVIGVKLEGGIKKQPVKNKKDEVAVKGQPDLALASLKTISPVKRRMSKPTILKDFVNNQAALKKKSNKNSPGKKVGNLTSRTSFEFSRNSIDPYKSHQVENGTSLTKHMVRGSSKKSSTSSVKKQNSLKLSQFGLSEKKDGIAPFKSKMSVKTKKDAPKKKSPKKKKIDLVGCLTERNRNSSAKSKDLKLATKKKSKSPTKSPSSKKKSI